MRRKTLLTYLIIVGILVLLNLPLRPAARFKAASADNMAPFQNVLSLVLVKSKGVFKHMVGARSALDDREHMLEEIGELKLQVRDLRGLQRENEDLRQQLGFRARQERNLVLCEVMTRGDVSGWWQTVRVNRGSEEGIKSGAAVLTVDGLVGRTTAVSRHTSDVLLIADPTCKVACRVKRTGALGVLSGTGVSAGGKSKLDMLCGLKPGRLDYIAKERRVLKGDQIVTSGLGGVFPEDLPVGRVVSSGLHVSGLYQAAEVMPSATIEALRYVFIITD